MPKYPRNTRKWIWIVPGVIVLVVVISIIYSKNNEKMEFAGLNETLQVGSLSFQLNEVTLQEEGSWIHNNCEKVNYVNGGRSGPYICIPSEVDKKVPEGYNLFWSFLVTNNGDEIKNVSKCGILLLEDGSQYKFELGRSSYDRTDICEHHIMIPGENIEFYKVFTFSNWSEVPGSKITFFSQQSDGLVRFAVDKSQIKYINNYKNVTISEAENI